jgi:hypothetical protein
VPGSCWRPWRGGCGEMPGIRVSATSLAHCHDFCTIGEANSERKALEGRRCCGTGPRSCS